jgi:hypothetical protein
VTAAAISMIPHVRVLMFNGGPHHIRFLSQDQAQRHSGILHVFLSLPEQCRCRALTLSLPTSLCFSLAEMAWILDV